MNFATKHAVESYLAEQAEGGVIVEVGCGKGDGLLALWSGTCVGRLLPIYGVDPYTPFTDELGASYGPQSLDEMQNNLKDLLGTRVFLKRVSGFTFGEFFSLPVSLIWFDLSMNAENLIKMFEAWHPRIVSDGVIGITGLCYNQLGTQALADYITATGLYERILTEQNLVACFRRLPPKKRGVFYIVDGDSYAEEANKSASSVKRWMPNIETFLYAVGGYSKPLPHIDHIYTLPPRQSKLWYLDSTRYFNQIVNERTDYGQLLYLDTDTWVASACMDMWQVLSHYDFAVAQAAGRDATPSAFGVPAAFTTPSIGVTLFRNDGPVRQMLADWLENFENHQVTYGDYDEAALRDTVYRNKRGLKIMTLPPEYSVRCGFGCWLYGAARILHARLPNLPEIAEEINSVTTMRLWRYGFLWYHKKA